MNKKVCEIAWKLGFQAQYFYGFTNGNYSRPNFCIDLKSLRGDYHSTVLDQKDAKIFLGRVVDYYHKDGLIIPDKNIIEALKYINSD